MSGPPLALRMRGVVPPVVGRPAWLLQLRRTKTLHSGAASCLRVAHFLRAQSAPGLFKADPKAEH